MQFMSSSGEIEII